MQLEQWIFKDFAVTQKYCICLAYFSSVSEPHPVFSLCPSVAMVKITDKLPDLFLPVEN